MSRADERAVMIALGSAAVVPDHRPGSRPIAAWLLDGASITIFAAMAVLAIRTFPDYGVTWDETWHMHYGGYILDWYGSGFSDKTALVYRLDYIYGGAFDAIGALITRLSRLPPHDTMHLFGSMVGILGVVGTWLLGRRLAGPLAGFLAALLLATTSVYYGDMFNNPKDLPFAVGYVWAIYCMVSLILELPNPRTATWVKTSIALGVAMSVRIGGLLTACYLLAILGAHALLRARWAKPTGIGDPRILLSHLRHDGPRFLATLAGAWAIMLVLWPWALLDPLRRPFLALGRMSRYTVHKRTMPFGDEEIVTFDVPWDYLPRYFGLKLPEIVLALAIVAAVFAIRTVVRHWNEPTRLPQVLVRALLALAILFPPIYAIVVHSSLYDGLRHFLFLVPLLCAVAAVTAVSILERARRRGRKTAAAAWLIPAAIVLSATANARTMVKLHPNQYLYFNHLAGGLPGVYERYDTDYYGNTYKEAFSRLHQWVWTHERKEYLANRYLITGCIPKFVAENYLAPNFDFKSRDEDEDDDFRNQRPDFFVGYQRSDCLKKHLHRPAIAAVMRQGALLTVIRDMRPEKLEVGPAKKGKKKPGTKPPKKPPALPEPAKMEVDREPTGTSHKPLSGEPPIGARSKGP